MEMQKGDDAEREDSEETVRSDDSTGLGLVVELVTLARNLAFAAVGGGLLSSYLEGRLGQNDTWIWQVLIFAILVIMSNLNLMHMRSERLGLSSTDNRESNTQMQRIGEQDSKIRDSK